MKGGENKRIKMKKSRGDPAKKHNEGAVLIRDEPVVSAFPRFLENFANALFIFFCHFSKFLRLFIVVSIFLSKKVPNHANKAIVIAICIPIPENFKY